MGTATEDADPPRGGSHDLRSRGITDDGRSVPRAVPGCADRAKYRRGLGVLQPELLWRACLGAVVATRPGSASSCHREGGARARATGALSLHRTPAALGMAGRHDRATIAIPRRAHV